MSSQTMGPLARPLLALTATAAAPAATSTAGPAVFSFCIAFDLLKLCRLGNGAAREIVDDDRRVEPGDRRRDAVDLFDHRPPFRAVHALGRSPRLPQIDAAGRAAVLRTDVVFPDQSRNALVFRRSRFEALGCIGERDRRLQLELNQGCDHDGTSVRKLITATPGGR